MTDVKAALNEHGIRLRRWEAGNHKATCPKCSHSRRKKTDPCLSVTIEAGGDAVWNCHHCAWAGGTARRMPDTPERSPSRRREKPKSASDDLHEFDGEFLQPDAQGASAAAAQRGTSELPPDVVEFFAKRTISEATLGDPAEEQGILQSPAIGQRMGG